jgi:hypothetical protein
MKTRTLLVSVWLVQFLTCLTSPLRGAGGIEVVPSLVEGVKIEGPNAEGFHAQFIAHIAHFKPGSGLDLLEPYYVRISNNSARAIVRFIVRSERPNKSGQPVAGTLISDHPLGDRLMPGTTELLSGIGGANPSAPYLAAAPYLRASIDAVVFENGEFVGPDAGGNFEKIKAHEEKITSLLVDLNSLGLGSKDAVLSRLDPLLKSQSFLDQVVAKQLKFAFSVPDQGREYFRLLDDLAAYPAVWRKP